MQTVVIEPRFDAWRAAARRLLAAGIEPGRVAWSDGDAGMFGVLDVDALVAEGAPVRVSPAFLELARTAAAHRDPRRWALLYRVLWRLTRGGEPQLLQVATDAELRQVQQWCKAVGRDIHKMHAFVRFQKVGELSGREQFVAWYEPDHRIVALAAPFFRKRFFGMDWSILTPDECVHWDGRQLTFSPGVARDQAPAGDELDDLWRTYYRSIFNPARLKVKMMQSQMPKKFWKNLPEADVIGELVSGSAHRVREMLEADERPVKPVPGHNAYLRRLREMNRRQDPPPPA